MIDEAENVLRSPVPESTDGHPLSHIFRPRNVAFVGASMSAEKLGGRRWKTLVDSEFPGRLFPVHPSAKEVRGHKAYKALHDIPEPVDLAIVAVRAELTPAVLHDCADLGIPGVIVLTGGFGEIDDKGRRIEQEMVAALNARGGRLVGPNCAGVFSAAASMNITGNSMPAGPIALVSQSGNMALDFAQMARQSSVGFSCCITIGNAADVRADEFVDYFLDDPDTRVVLVYLEGFGPNEGRRLYEIARRRQSHRAKPIVILKPGRTEAGRRAAMSHTGSLAGEDRLVRAAFEQSGLIRAYETEEAWELAAVLASKKPLPSNSVAVLTDGGGHATLFCDTAGVVGLTVPRPTEKTVAALRTFLPNRCQVVNPIDFAGEAEANPDVIPRALEACLEDENFAAVAIVGHFGGYHKIASPQLLPLEMSAATAIVAAARRCDKPVVVHSIHAGSNDNPVLAVIRQGGIPVYRAVEMPAKVLGGLTHQTESKVRDQVLTGRLSPVDVVHRTPLVLSQAVQGEAAWLQEPEARQLLELYGVNIPRWRVAENAEACATATAKFNEEVALKLIAPQAMHKTEIGGVLLNVNSRNAANAFRELLSRAPVGSRAKARVLVTPMIYGGIELVIGAFRDPQFGPVIMAGLGGTLVELIEDIAFRLAPVSLEEARHMLKSLRMRPLFTGYRGRPGLSIEPLADLIVRLSELMGDLTAVTEVDLNPVFMDDKKMSIADVRVVLAIKKDGAGK